MDSTIFKTALSKMPTGVTVISTSYDEELFGFTSNSFASVSLQPSLISFCLEKSARSITAFSSTTHFTVSILNEYQKDISKHFAAHIEDKFQAFPYQLSKYSQCPFIEGALCWLECKKVTQYEGGDHLIFIGEVIDTIINKEQNPLIYFEKEYRSIK